MMDKAQQDNGRTIPWRVIGWSIPAVLLLLPLVANAPWTLGDYVVMGAMFGIAGLGIELAVRASGDLAYRVGAGVAVAAAFLLVWVNLAVGFLGDEGNPANLMFAGVLAVALIGSFAARFQARGMSRTMNATAACQVLVGAIALGFGLGASGRDGLYEAVMGTSLFTGLWLASAWLFARASRRLGATA